MERKYVFVLFAIAASATAAYAFYSYYIPISSCASSGGVWGAWGALAEEGCNQPASDAGKSCSSSSDCEGTCAASLSQEDMDIVAEGGAVRTGGNCTSWKLVSGCEFIVENGTVERVCAD